MNKLTNRGTNEAKPDVTIREAFDRLDEYEDAEEDKLLLKLRCKVGDTVYVLPPGSNRFEKSQVDKIEIKPTVFGETCYFVEPVARRGSLYKFYEDDFGKMIFLTQSEAEEALEEMEK